MFKDTLITARQKKRELIIWLACFAAAIIFNFVAILMYNTPFKELYTQWHVVLMLSVFFYLMAALFRVLYCVVRKLYFKIKNVTG